MCSPSPKTPVVPAAELGSRNIAELLVQLVVSQSDAIIGKAGASMCHFSECFSSSFSCVI